ncbi:MAG TPA: NYN domain-containing protein [Anaerolineales bacterium]|nr:NYN domain-containing protein [Anaerolineales bacterium]
MRNIAYAKVGVFIDAANVYMNGGQKMRYDVLRQYAQEYGTIQRLNAYMTFDADRSQTDREYHARATGWQDVVRSFGFHTTIKDVRWMVDPDSGRRYAKANADIHLAVDMLSQASNLDHIILVTGDGDFVRAIQYVRNMGCRVEVIGFDNVSQDLRKEADVYTSGFLIPELLPTNRRDTPWGTVESTVRGVCYYHKDEDDYGFLAFLEKISPLSWITDPRHPESPYKAVFFHDSLLPEGVPPRSLPNRWTIFEFEIGQNERGFFAEDLRLVAPKIEQNGDRFTSSLMRDRNQPRSLYANRQSIYEEYEDLETEADQ